ncbi:MAG: inositol monophosphatase [Sphingomonadales bacterium]|nr:inositol monophosphatase [Sphingomonadales bacterium]
MSLSSIPFVPEPGLSTRVEALALDCGTYLIQARELLQEEHVRFKDKHNLVTHADVECEKRLIKGLSKLCPQAAFQTEEAVVVGVSKGLRWIIDPLDGTTNFVHKLPFYSISIALAEDDDLLLGVVYSPCTLEMFSAVKGAGAFLNGIPIRVSNQEHLEDALLATGFPYYRFDRMEEYMASLGQLMRQCRGLRRLGSAALDLAYVACGRFDAYFEHNLQPWDVAAGILLVREAGGVVSGIRDGINPLHGTEIVASGTALAAKVWKELNPERG